jgi:hypothetical protein
VEGRVEVIGQFAAWNARIEATRLLSDYFWLRLSIQNVYYHYSLQEWTTAAINTTASVGVEWRFRW